VALGSLFIEELKLSLPFEGAENADHPKRRFVGLTRSIERQGGRTPKYGIPGVVVTMFLPG